MVVKRRLEATKTFEDLQNLSLGVPERDVWVLSWLELLLRDVYRREWSLCRVHSVWRRLNSLRFHCSSIRLSLVHLADLRWKHRLVQAHKEIGFRSRTTS